MRTFKEHCEAFPRAERHSLSVIIPTLNAAPYLRNVFLSIFDAAIEGLVGEVIISDGGSSDDTRAIAEAAGATVIDSPCGRGPQLRAGAEIASKPWLLFLHADTALAVGWEEAVRSFIAEDGTRAAAFRLRLADEGVLPRAFEAMTAVRCRLFGLPSGHQGLLVSRRLYEAAGGFAPIPLMEDVDLARRLGRIAMLNADAIASAERFRGEGYVRRSARNLLCLSLYLWGVPPERLAQIHREARVH